MDVTRPLLTRRLVKYRLRVPPLPVTPALPLIVVMDRMMAGMAQGNQMMQRLIVQIGIRHVMHFQFLHVPADPTLVSVPVLDPLAHGSPCVTHPVLV